MKLKNVHDAEKFFEAVNQCKGSVFLTTMEGDRLNLKSQLTKYVALTTMFQSSIIKEIELELSNPADIALMMKFSLEED